MSLNAPPFYKMPDETVLVVKLPSKGNRYLLLPDTFGPFFHNAVSQPLFSHIGQPDQESARLVLITILQLAERLSDEQAAEAVCDLKINAPPE